MKKIIAFLSSLKLASLLLLILMLLTWLGTLEQVDYGLHATIQKYFTWKNIIVFPDLTINGKQVPIPLPGAYWVGALLFLNMLLGGILRIRKGWRQSGILISHFGILMLLFGAFITHHFSQRGSMRLYEGQTSNYAESYHDHVIEVAELNDTGLAQKIHVIPTHAIQKVIKGGARGRTVSHTSLPFEIHLSHYFVNCRPLRVGPLDKQKTPSVDSLSLFEMDPDPRDELNYNGCYAKTSSGKEFLLYSLSLHPYILEHADKKYAISLRKKIWNIPFKVKLRNFNVEFFPSGKAKKYESYVTRVENNIEEEVKIYMNHPMRYRGFTFFQASWGPQRGLPERQLFSVFEVVKNPADHWPLYSIIITSFGLIGHFGYMLIRYIFRQTKMKT